MSVNLDTLYRQVRELCRSNGFELARSLCEHHFTRAQTDTDRAHILSRIAFVEEAVGNLTTAVSYLERASSLDPESRAVLDALMTLYIRKGDYEKVPNVCFSLIVLDKQFPYQSFTSSAYLHLAYCHLQLGELESAEAALVKCDYDDVFWIDGKLSSKAQMLTEIRAKPASYS